MLKSHPELVWIDLDRTKEKQIVQSTAGEETEKAAPDAFLGEKNRSVEHESLAKKQMNPLKLPPIAHLGVPLFEPKGMHIRKDPADWTRFGESFEQLSENYVKGVNEGEQTALNTKEFVFYGYFKRIRDRLDLAWYPLLRVHLYKLQQKGRFLASDMEHTTRTMVTLNLHGEVVRVRVIEESGLRDLDEAAVSAFNKAGPFPNPPSGLIDANGEIQIRWDFILRT